MNGSCGACGRAQARAAAPARFARRSDGLRPGAGRALVAISLALAGLGGAAPAAAQIKPCDELRDEIAAGLDSRGVQDYVLDIVPADATGTGKLVGSCNGGASRIYYRRDNVVAPADADAEGAASAPVAAASAARKGTRAATGAPPGAKGSDPAAAAPPAEVTSPTAAPAPHGEVVDDNAPIERWLEQIAVSQIHFTTPAEARQGEATRVELTVQLDTAAEALRRQVNAAAKGDSARMAGRHLHARLLGQHWRIAPLTPTELAVEPGKLARWQWEVTPLDAGAQRLHLSVSANIGQGAFATPRTVRTFDRGVEVATNADMAVAPFLPPRETLMKWSLLGLGGLLALVLGGWWLMRRR